METGMVKGIVAGLALVAVVAALLLNGAESSVCAGDVAGGNGKWLAWSVSAEDGKEYALLFNTETESLATYGVTRSGEVGLYSVRTVCHDFGPLRQLNNAADTYSVKQMEELQNEAANRQKTDEETEETETK